MTATLFTTDPSPPQKGEMVKVCYDFSGGGSGPVNAKLTVDLQGGGELIFESSLVPREPCFTVELPDNATWFTVEDPAGSCDDLTGAVV